MEKYKIEFSEKEIEVILEGLGEIPYKKSATIIAKIVTAVKDQTDGIPPEKQKRESGEFKSFQINGKRFQTCSPSIDRKTLIDLALLSPEGKDNESPQYCIELLCTENRSFDFLILDKWTPIQGAEISIIKVSDES